MRRRFTASLSAGALAPGENTARSLTTHPAPPAGRCVRAPAPSLPSQPGPHPSPPSSACRRTRHGQAAAVTAQEASSSPAWVDDPFGKDRPCRGPCSPNLTPGTTRRRRRVDRPPFDFRTPRHGAGRRRERVRGTRPAAGRGSPQQVHRVPGFRSREPRVSGTTFATHPGSRSSGHGHGHGRAAAAGR